MAIKGYKVFKDNKLIQTINGHVPRRDLDKLRRNGSVIKKIKNENYKTRK